MSSVSAQNTWQVEKERMLSLSLEKRRKARWLIIYFSHCFMLPLLQEYSCGDSYIQLSHVKTWKDVGKSEKLDFTDKKFKKISDNLLKEFEFDTSLDLANKVSYQAND